MVLTGLPSRRRMYNFTVEGTTPAGEKVVMFRTFRVGMHIVIIVAVKPYIYIITRKTVVHMQSYWDRYAVDCFQILSLTAGSISLMMAWLSLETLSEYNGRPLDQVQTTVPHYSPAYWMEKLRTVSLRLIIYGWLLNGLQLQVLLCNMKRYKFEHRRYCNCFSKVVVQY